ncbi:MAG: carboxypeptidase M32 [Alphaproteobacteria bacterium]
MTSDAYAALEGRFGRIAKVGGALSILHWDQSVIMPPGGAEARGEQIAALRLLVHEMLTDPEVAAWLEDAEARGGLDPWQSANLRAMRRRYDHATAVPARLVEALSLAITRCETVWRTARAESDYPMLLPHLREVLSLTREAAAAKGARLGLAPYDALLDEFDPGRPSERIDAIFADLESWLPDLLARSLERQGPAPARPAGSFPIATQRRLAEGMMRAWGFDFDRGRLDVSLHPFSGGVPDDSRITTRYDEDDYASALMGVLHETGHALYEQGLPKAWRYQPVGGDMGMAAHESQSLFVEMQVCRSRAFAGFLAPLLGEAFQVEGPAWTADNLYRAGIRVDPGYIRVDADEVTYPAHILLRYRLEKQMIGGALDLADLPEAWGDGMEALLGIRPPDDRRGCLQDIHWPDGAWGYFPSYTLGAMAAAQLYQAAEADIGPLDALIGRGEFGQLVGWMRARFHGRASFDGSCDALLEQATGRTLDPTAFRRHLERRYLG